MLKADAAERDAFVTFYVALRQEAEKIGARICGGSGCSKKDAVVTSTNPRLGEKVTYYSAVCLETGEVLDTEVSAMCNAETSVAFLRHFRESHTGTLNVIWDNAPAGHGEATRAYLATPDLHLRPVSLPGYSPDYNADEAISDWIRDEVTANTCLGMKVNERDKVGAFFQRLADRHEEVKRRCRSLLQEHDDALLAANPLPQQAHHRDPTLAFLENHRCGRSSPRTC